MLNSQTMESTTSPSDLSASPSYHTYAQTLFPFHINSSYLQDDTTFDITASIEMSYRRTFADSITSPSSATAASTSQPKYLESAFFAPRDDLLELSSVEWSNNLASSAQYNRTLDHSTVFIQSDTAHGNYRIASSSSSSSCYLREVLATEGEIVSDEQQGECSLPNGKYVCGYDLCQGNPHQTWRPLSRPLPLHTELPPQKSSRDRSEDSSAALPFRHPLVGTRSPQEATILHHRPN
jgi:hypothetical protein